MLLDHFNEMMDLMDVSGEIQESLGRSYIVPGDNELLGGKIRFNLVFFSCKYFVHSFYLWVVPYRA